MTKFIVSVRNAAEAALAASAGADLIDVKEPLRGALGAADVETIEEVATLLDGRIPISAALGELDVAIRLPDRLAGRIRYAKIGLAGTQPRPDWLAGWRNAIVALPPGIAPVAVAYADWKSAAAPPLDAVLEHAAGLNCRAVLLDTFSKSNGCLFDHLTVQDVTRFVDSARQRELTCVLAGGLHANAITQAIKIKPDYLAVRTAVCDSDRTGQLDGRRVAQLASVIQSSGWHAIA
jgi:uncharacterized protein (UPF0264 family)